MSRRRGLQVVTLCAATLLMSGCGLLPKQPPFDPYVAAARAPRHAAKVAAQGIFEISTSSHAVVASRMLHDFCITRPMDTLADPPGPTTCTIQTIEVLGITGARTPTEAARAANRVLRSQGATSPRQLIPLASINAYFDKPSTVGTGVQSNFRDGTLQVSLTDIRHKGDFGSLFTNQVTLSCESDSSGASRQARLDAAHATYVLWLDYHRDYYTSKLLQPDSAATRRACV